MMLFIGGESLKMLENFQDEQTKLYFQIMILLI